MERIIPNVMKTPLTDLVNQNKTIEGAGVDNKNKEVTARVENLKEGVCPICDETMKISKANGIPVYVCLNDSVVMPIRDPEPVTVTIS